MVELGKIEKPDAMSFKEKRKLYVVPSLPFEELAYEFKIDDTKVESFWSEVREKIDHFVSMYGSVGILYIEGMDENKNVGIEFFEKLEKESSHYKLLKALVDSGAKIRGIDNEEHIRRSRLLFEEYSKTFLQETKEIHQGFYGKDIDFDKWREYLVKKIQETQEEMNRLVSKLIQEMPEDNTGVLIITEGRPVEYPQNMDVFMIRPPSFDEIARNIRDLDLRNVR